MPALKQRKVRGNTAPPSGARPTGEIIAWAGENLPVYREKRPWSEISEVVPVEVGGAVQYHRGVNGEPIKARTERRQKVGLTEADLYYEYIIIDRGNGMTVKHFNFRETEAETAARESEVKRARFEDELYEAVTEAGMDIKDFVKRVVGGKGKAA
jgi:hypothetical protein